MAKSKYQIWQLHPQGEKVPLLENLAVSMAVSSMLYGGMLSSI